MAEPTVNQLVTTTINNYHKSFADNVTNSNAVTALLRKGDQPLQLGLYRLCLGLGRLNPLVIDHLAAQIHEQGLPVGGVPRELASLLAVPHSGGNLIRRVGSARARRGSP